MSVSVTYECHLSSCSNTKLLSIVHTTKVQDEFSELVSWLLFSENWNCTHMMKIVKIVFITCVKFNS